MNGLPYQILQLENLPNEIWVDAIGFDGIYEVSNLGRIKSLGRYVRNGSSERLVRERIRKQVLTRRDRLTCPFSIEGESVSINIPALVYFSFNYEKEYSSRKFCIMHKNKLASDNRLSNLKLVKVSNSHSINFKKSLLPHLAKNNKLSSEKYNALTHKICVKCSKEKRIEYFEHGRNKCKECRNLQRKKDYLKRKLTLH